MDGGNENLIQQFNRKLEGIIDLGITFKQFGYCYVGYFAFSAVMYSS